MAFAGPDFGDIADRLNARIESLCAQLLPDGRRNGGYWIAANPMRNDRRAGSFWVRIKDPVGVWKDEATGDQGDVIKLVRYLGGFSDYSQTRSWCLRWLGLPASGLPLKGGAENTGAPASDRRELKGGAENIQKNRKSAFGLWLGATEIGPQNYASTLQPYLEGARGIPLAEGWLAQGQKFPGALRYSMQPYRMAEGTDPGRDAPFPRDDRGRIVLPCMVALLLGGDGRPVGVHRTWLNADRSDKAALPEQGLNKARKIWPSGWQGGAIRVAKGAGGMSPEQAGRKGVRGPLILTEGIEDALAAMIACPDHRVWAMGTLGNMAHAPVLPCVSRIVLCADNDWNNPQAANALERAVESLRRGGRPVAVARSWRGKDVNDLLKA